MSLSEHSYVANTPQGRERQFGLQQVVCAGRHTLVLSGELDLASAEELGVAVAHVRMDRRMSLVLDLRRLTFIDSTGMRAVLVTRELCANRGCEFRLIPGRAAVQRVFEICGLLDRLPFEVELSAGSPEGTRR